MVTSVAPYVGAWIETLTQLVYGDYHQVAPYVGAWIETTAFSKGFSPVQVAPYVGAWIETYRENMTQHSGASHPTWVRGLKHIPAMVL